MDISKLEQDVEQYGLSLEALLESDPPFPRDRILDVLIKRDAVRRLLKEAKLQEAEEALLLINDLDHQLRVAGPKIAAAADLEGWCATLNPHEDAWWWKFEKPIHPADRLDWLYSAMAVLFLSISLSFTIDISSRFLSGGSDMLGAFAIISQSILTLFAASGALTKPGRQAIERVFEHLGIPAHWQKEMKAGITFVLAIILIGFRLSLPTIAVFYNNRGLERYISGQLTSAEFDYQRALSLNPDFVEAHYNLGLLYEDLQKLDEAVVEYEEASQSGLAAAYNNLARLHILQGENSQAVALLLDGLSLTDDPNIRYSMLKNLGWARLEQDRLPEARTRLEDAIRLAEDRAPAHCLLAQVLEKQVEAEQAMVEWESCLQYASSRDPDEDVWIGMARLALTNPLEEE